VTSVRCLALATSFFLFDALSSANYLRTVGKTLAFTNIEFTNPNGHVVARGSHTKCVLPTASRSQLLMLFRYVTLAWKDPNNIVEEVNKLKDLKEK
jgi:hypothetical protein